MSGKKDKELRKANQVQGKDKDINKIVKKVVEKQSELPFNKRWRIAMKIFMGRGVSKMIIFLWTLFSILLIAFFSISFYVLFIG
ncbi:hypothetical protein KAR91_47965 [Candidatus Pacearchaeota archaeon]|nr:hypothetical protein [Candidatus Pacearchaeota archaeon]